MKLTNLLSQRSAIVRQAYLANLAYAYATLRDLDQRVRRVGLRGNVELKQIDPREERFWPTLHALEGNQSLIEEHFSDEDVGNLADAIAFAREDDRMEVEFPLDQINDCFVIPLRVALERAGVVLDAEKQPVEEKSSQ